MRVTILTKDSKSKEVIEGALSVYIGLEEDVLNITMPDYMIHRSGLVSVAITDRDTS